MHSIETVNRALRVLGKRQEARDELAEVIREARAGKAWVYARRLRGDWAYKAPKNSARVLRIQATRMLRWAKEPIRARYCGDDDAEGEAKEAAGERAKVFLVAADILDALEGSR